MSAAEAAPLDAPTAAERGRYDALLAGLRLALVPLLIAGERLVEHPRQHSAAFGWIVAAYAAWSVAVLAFHARAMRYDVPSPRWLARAEPVVDLAGISALTYTSGGAFSQLRLAFFAVPVVAAFRLKPAHTAIASAAGVLAYVAVSVPHPATVGAEGREAIAVHAGYLAWAGAGAVLLSQALAVRNRRIARDADLRGRLVAQALEAEDRERRRLAQHLHDEAVQDLLLARHELRDLRRRGDEAAYLRTDEALTRVVAQLRGEIFDLRPHLLDHAGLPATLEAIGERHAERTGATVHVHVDPAVPTRHDELLVSIARELLANAAKHSAADHVDVHVGREDGAVVLEVADDGRGFTEAARAAAQAAGHIGLASIAERVRALGGTMQTDAAPGAGTRVGVRLPV